MKITDKVKKNPVIRQITREEIEGLLSTELGVRKAEFSASNWEEIIDHCRLRVVWYTRGSNLVDLLEAGMEDYYKLVRFFILDKGKE